MTTRLDLDPRLLRLRTAFDEAFTSAPTAAATEAHEDFLTVRVAGDPYALRVREIAGLVPSRKIVPLPSRRPSLLGIAGIRGSIVPVFSLGAILGYHVGSKPLSWLALVGTSEPIGLGFDEFESFVRLPRAEVHAAHATDRARPHAREVARFGQQSRLVVDVPSTLEKLNFTGIAGSLSGSQ